MLGGGRIHERELIKRHSKEGACILVDTQQWPGLTNYADNNGYVTFWRVRRNGKLAWVSVAGRATDKTMLRHILTHINRTQHNDEETTATC